MAVDLGRWWKYAQAKLSSAVDAENLELDALEAERAAEVADKPWLAADGDAPTLEEAKARIEWEAEDQRRRSEAGAATPTAPASPGPPRATEAPASPGDAATGAPVDRAALDPEVAAARIELDRQAREGAARLDAIRKELGVGPPEADGPAPKA